MHEKNLSFIELAHTGRRYPAWAGVCLFFAVIIEVFFLVYPPRGYIADDIILFASVRGQPLISVQNLWEDVFNDDRLMLEVLEKSGVKPVTEKVEALEFLNENVRKNLRFSMLNEVLYRISYIQPGKSDLRPFLNTFSDRLLQEASVLCDDELNKRRQRVGVQFEQLRRRNLLIHRLFAPMTPLQDLTPGDEGFIGELDPAKENSLFGKLGTLIINELNRELFSAKVHQLTHTDLNQKILSLFPFSTMRLTDPATPPRAVQPYLPVFYLFIPVAFLLFYLAGLIYLHPVSRPEKN